MEKWLHSLGWKKLSALLIGCAFFIFLLLMYSVTYENGMFAIPTTSPTPTLIAQSGSQSPQNFTFTVENATPTTTLISSKSRFINVSYPSGWSEKETPLAGQGISLTLQQGVLLDSPRITIDRTTSSYTPVKNILDTFSALGYSRSSTRVQGITAAKYMGSVMTEPTPLQESVIIVENKGIVYKFQLSYYSKQRDSEVERTFQTVVSSLQF